MGPNREHPTLCTCCGAPRLRDHVGHLALPSVPISPGPGFGTPGARRGAHRPRRTLLPDAPWPRPTRISGQAGPAPPSSDPTPRPAPLSAPASPSCIAPSPSALGRTFSFCFRGVSILTRAAFDSKSVSLRSFPGIIQHKWYRPADINHRVERKRES